MLSPQLDFVSGMKWNIITTWWGEVGKSYHANNTHVYGIAGFDLLFR